MNHHGSRLTGVYVTGFVLAAVGHPDQETRHRSGPLWLVYGLFAAAGAALGLTIVAGLFLWWRLTRRSAHRASRTDDRYPRDITLSPRTEIRLWPQTDAAEPAPEPIPSPAVDAPIAVPDREPPPHDELQRIRGIGPKSADLLQSAGILTYSQLAMTDIDALQEILVQAGISALVDPTTWPEQARLAAEDDWDALAALQEELRTRH